MINPNTGLPVRVIDMTNAVKLGIKTDLEMGERVADFPISVLGNTITSLFDSVPISSSTLFSIYNEITIDIRKARQKGNSVIEISKDSLEKFKTIFAGKPPVDPKNNRNIAFIIECIDLALAKSVTETISNN